MKKIYLLLLTFCPFVGFGQEVFTRFTTQDASKPTATADVQALTQPDLLLDKVDVSALLAADKKEEGQGVPPRFGVARSIIVDCKTQGKWQTVADGRNWQFAVSSPGAFSLNFFFKKFYLPPQAELYIYNSDHRVVMGPITAKQNTQAGVYATDLLPGDVAYFELHEPTAVVGKSQLFLSRVVHGYRNLFSQASYAAGYGQSAACNVDVACAAGANWQNESNSVAMVLLANGTRLCSGSLLNNACQDLTPNFLTAFHCLDGDGSGNLSVDEQNAVQSWVFRFRYKSATCGGADVANFVSLSGAQYSAASRASDFALLQLFQRPTPASGLAYAGWSREGVVASSSASLHHPNGDVMKIAASSSATQNIGWNPPGETNPTFNTHWRADFNVGTVEHGSSGGPLFDQNHRVVGQLHGNQFTNGNYCAEHAGDYGRFDVSWTGGGTAQTSLQSWLTTDPSVVTVNTFQYPSVQGPDLICAATTYSLSTLGGIANVSWGASDPTILSINGSTGAAQPLKNGTVTVNAIISLTGGCGVAQITKSVQVFANKDIPTGVYSYMGGTTRSRLQTQQYVASGQYTIYMDQATDYSFSATNPTGGVAVPITKTGRNSASFTLNRGATVQVRVTPASSCLYNGTYVFSSSGSSFAAYDVTPNPATSDLTVTRQESSASAAPLANQETFARPAPARFEAVLYDSFGRKVKSQSTTNSKVFLEINDLPNGLYTLRINDGLVNYSQHIQVAH